jgi:hypothetical protein
VRQPSRPASSGESSVKSKNIPIPALPRYGKLGLELEALGVDITEMYIIVRFTGLFDTVSSYGLCFKKEKDTEIFGLDAVTISRNTLHIASADEHRHFFPLVNIKSTGFNEKTFPGVHSDIGGSYVEGADEIKNGIAISTEKYVRSRYQKVVKEGWYTKDQLTIVRPTFLQRKQAELYPEYKKVFLDYTVEVIQEHVIRLRGEKKHISVAYSYIPLHIMCEYAMKPGIYIKFKDKKLKDKYNIKGHDDLIKVQKRLEDVVFNNAQEMIFYSRAVLEDQIEDLRPGGRRNIYEKEDLGSCFDPVPLNPNWGKAMIIEPFVTDKVLIQKIKDHNTILMLRGKYLHRSADWFEAGFNPTKHETRIIWNG